ncbi:hypothetical protein HF086_015321 [Spodoptera exigua]|uniref:C2H2-type domain-containing protein n=1 Tax=Spodoptera exigua TaxID=7107 RepID=A0A922M191_SPOEX|nr:hypothetical protein HF086_015321 [Spodoptera exigua]
MNTKKEFNCVFCKDTFDNKEDLQEHFRKHGDPQYKKRFEISTQGTDQKSKEKAELVTCDVCSQVFPTISKAITHKHKVHPDHDAKYFCPWCGKLFTLKHLYNVHVRSTHGAEEESTEDKRFHCDCCNVDFFIASAMLNHNKFFHRQDTDLPDIGQSKKIKTYSQVIISIYYCPFCGEEYENKVNLFVMCEAVFYHLDAYEIHLTFHTTEDMYSINNPAFTELLDFSLETVPPIIEKVENADEIDNPQTDAESTMNAVGIEKFLELAIDHAEEEDTGPVKPKKHKKHKKSKKSAITLDEFLSMNQDVFGEDLDFQGIEEVPTRVVKKQLKNNMNVSNNATTSAELDKLKKAGIVVKRKVNPNQINQSIKKIKLPTSTPSKTSVSKPVPKSNQIREIETSSEVLNKLINQSNNQIKIVKKVNPNAVSIEPKETIKDTVEETETSEEDANKMVSNDTEINSTQTDTDSIKETTNIEEPPISAGDTQYEENKLSESNTDTELDNETNKSVVPDSNKRPQELSDAKTDHSPKSTNNITTKDNEKTYEPDYQEIENYSEHSETEFDDADHASDLDSHIEDDKALDDNKTNNKYNTTLSASANSLSTLKRLSHLITVKPVGQNKNNTLTESKTDKIPETINDTENPNKKEDSSLPVDKVHVIKSKTVDKDPTLDALKTLSKNITIKSMSTKRNICESNNDEIDENDQKTSGLQLQDTSSNKNITIKKTKLETNETKPVVNHQERRYVLGQHISKSPTEQISKTKIEKDNNTLPNSNAHILKRLPNINITTKPVINKSKCLPANVKQTNVPKKVVEPQKPEEIIEIFDIDDSEDEQEISRNPPQPIQKTPGPSKSIDALKNLSKNITVKSVNQAPYNRSSRIENNIKIEKEDTSSQQFKDESNNESNFNMQNKNVAVKNILQGISKNITIKSRNTSPSQFTQSQENSQDSKEMEDDYASDLDSNPGKVQITEIDEDMELDNCDEEHSENIEEPNETVNNPIIESPKESCSENEDDDIHDFEQDIRVNTVQRSQQTINSTVNSVCLNNLKSINKNLTIKSINKSSIGNDDDSKTHIHSQDSQETINVQKKQVPTKSNQVVKEIENDNVAINRVSKNDNSSAFLKKVSSMNTVNKEVTVKTIQTKTMIQEITTTVTKTIKTVNQTMKQEIRNSVQTNTPTQRIQGMRPVGPKNLQGVVIRHANPVAKTSNTVSKIRPCNAIRNSNQNVAIRSPTPINIARPNNPRMMIGKKVTTSPSPHKANIVRPSSPSSNKPVIGRPLKISPSAVIKRPIAEEVNGPFSCFKKPKESLIPVSDIPAFNNSSRDGTVQYTSASQSSSSNFTSSTKLVKGNNSVVTAKQIKSEVNSSSQQITRLSNVSGLKITTSQQRQSQVQENSESSGMKRTTLEAIQRLQKQGLLVKKPRVDPEGPDASDHDSDQHVEHSSADEQDE